MKVDELIKKLEMYKGKDYEFDILLITSFTGGFPDYERKVIKESDIDHSISSKKVSIILEV